MNKLRSLPPQVFYSRGASTAKSAASNQSPSTTGDGRVKLGEMRPMIGLEIHAQLHCATKLFSGAPSGSTLAANASSSAAPSNSRVALFDMATPGTLPRLNRRSVEQCLRAANLLNCRVADWCRFDRKHYFYPDMPTGYQITQKDFPIAEDGFLEFFVFPPLTPFTSQNSPAKSRKKASSSSANNASADETMFTKRVRIERLQLEMDSGKVLKHGDGRLAAVELVDLNRAGVALVEIVTAPELSSAREAACFVEQLRVLLLHNAICAGEMHKGHLRVDANVSISRAGVPGRRTEIKNINSFRFLQGAIESEIHRQSELLSRGEEIVEETRTLDVDNLNTISMREKGDALDYRFTPEPNLPRLRIEREWIESARQSVSHDLPHFKYIRQFQFPPAFALQIVKDEHFKSFIDECLTDEMHVDFNVFHDWIVEFKRICEDNGRNFPPNDKFLSHSFRDTIRFESQGRLTRAICFDVLKDCVLRSIDNSQDGISLEQKINDEKLWRICDVAQIELQIDETIRQHPHLLEKAMKVGGGPKPGNKHFNRLRNEVVFASSKRISVEDAERVLAVKLCGK